MADNNSNGGGRRRWTTAADDNGTQDWAADYIGEGREWAENNDSIKHKGRRRQCCFQHGSVHLNDLKAIGVIGVVVGSVYHKYSRID